jgi:hypothetical protein
MVHRSTLESPAGFFDDFTRLDEVGLVALCWSEGLLPSDALADPHAAVVRSAATAPAPRAYLFQLPRLLRFPQTTFTEVPLVQLTKFKVTDASHPVKVGRDFGEGGGELMTASACAAARPAAPSVIQLIR